MVRLVLDPGTGNSAHKVPARRQMRPRQRTRLGALAVLGQPAAPAQPGKGPFENPTLRQRGDALLLAWLPDCLQLVLDAMLAKCRGHLLNGMLC